MERNSKFLSILSLLIVISGISLLWFGLNISHNVHSTPGVSTGVNQEVHTGSDNLIPEKPADEPEVSGMDGEKAYVARVVDGDTVDVVIDGVKHSVRLLGVDTPETVDPRKSVQCFGKEASNEAKKILSGKTVILRKDVSDTDFYKRWLRFIYLPLDDGSYLFVNDYLIREGYAKVLTIPPDVKFSEQFLEAQREARLQKKGLWGRC